MRAAQVTRLDGPDGIEVTDVEEPTGDGIVVDVHAAGAAFPDALLTRGLYQYRPEPPFVLGSEIAGVVRSAPNNAHIRAGDRVVGLTMLTGGMAEVAVLQPDRAFKLPDNVTFEAGAGVLFNDLTVYFALSVRGRFQRGETVLVHGAAGDWNVGAAAGIRARRVSHHRGGQHRGEGPDRHGRRRDRRGVGRGLQGRGKGADRRPRRRRCRRPRRRHRFTDSLRSLVPGDRC